MDLTPYLHTEHRAGLHAHQGLPAFAASTQQIGITRPISWDHQSDTPVLT